MASKLVKGGFVLAVVIISAFTVLAIILLLAIFCGGKDSLLEESNLISNLFVGIGIGVAFLGISYFVEKSKEDYIKENEKLHTIILAERSMQEAYKNYTKECSYNLTVFRDFIDYTAKRNQMFRNGLNSTNMANGIENYSKAQSIDIFPLFFHSIKNIEFKKFNTKEIPYCDIEDLSKIDDAGVFKIELFSGAKFVYCPKLDKTVFFNTDDEFQTYYNEFEKSDSILSNMLMASGVENHS